MLLKAQKGLMAPANGAGSSHVGVPACGGATRGGDAVAAGAHGEGGGRRRGLAGARREFGWGGHPEGPQLLHLALQAAVLLRQRAEAPPQVGALHLRLLQLAPACMQEVQQYPTQRRSF